MNVMWDVGKFDEATCQLLAILGLNDATREVAASMTIEERGAEV